MIFFFLEYSLWQWLQSIGVMHLGEGYALSAFFHPEDSPCVSVEELLEDYMIVQAGATSPTDTEEETDNAERQ